jgi:hypothetical protein
VSALVSVASIVFVKVVIPLAEVVAVFALNCVPLNSRPLPAVYVVSVSTAEPLKYSDPPTLYSLSVVVAGVFCSKVTPVAAVSNPLTVISVVDVFPLSTTVCRVSLSAVRYPRHSPLWE